MQPGDGDLVFLNPGETFSAPAATRVLALHAATGWLNASFPAVFGGHDARPFSQPREPITPRMRRLADTLAVEVLNDRFVSAERLDFLLQELLLSIVETYLARRHSAAPAWRGSRFEDGRIRRAIALLRARPTKDFNMDELASQVGPAQGRGDLGRGVEDLQGALARRLLDGHLRRRALVHGARRVPIPRTCS